MLRGIWHVSRAFDKHSQTVNLLIILDNMMVILLFFINFCLQVLGSHLLLIYNQNFHYAGLYLLLLCLKMEGDAYSTPGNGNEIDSKVMQTFQKGFGHVQNILDQNRLLIKEINQNQESKMPDNLGRNVALIRELNNNITRVVDLYAGLSSSFTKAIETSSDGDSGGTLKSDGNPAGSSGQKRFHL